MKLGQKHMQKRLLSNQILSKEKCTSHTIACLTLFMCVFCHTPVENLLKGPDICSHKDRHNVPSSYYQSNNGLMVTHAPGHMMYVHYARKCMSYHETTGRLVKQLTTYEYYALLTSVGFEHSVCHEYLPTSLPYTFKLYIYIYIYIFAV